MKYGKSEGTPKGHEWIETKFWPEPWQRLVAIEALSEGRHVEWRVWAVENGEVGIVGDRFVYRDKNKKESDWYRSQVLGRFWKFMSQHSPRSAYGA